MGAAATPMIIGSAIGAAVNKKNPLQGALLGGALGGFGGSIYSGAQGLASANIAAAAPSGTAGALAGGGSSAYYPLAGSTTAMGGSSYMPTVMSQVPTSGTPLAEGVKVVGSASLSEPTFMQTMSQVPSAISQSLDDVGQYAQKNPVLVATAAQAGQGLLQQPERQLPPSGLIRGTPSQVAAPQYQVGIPKVSLI